MNDSFQGTTLRTAPTAYRYAFHRGWVEVQNGQSYSREYDTAMTPSEQIGYECGRLCIANVLASRAPVPMWSGYLAGCEQVEAAISCAAARVGPCLPGLAW